MKISLREAKKEDAQLLYEWSQDKVVRQMAFSSADFSWENHERWFANKMESDNCRIYIAENETGKAVGQIRFDVIDGERAEVDVHTDPNWRGRGLGSEIIGQGTRKLVESVAIETVDAIVKAENIKSKKAFLKVGYKEIETECIHGQECYRLRFFL